MELGEPFGVALGVTGSVLAIRVVTKLVEQDVVEIEASKTRLIKLNLGVAVAKRCDGYAKLLVSLRNARFRHC
jgi:hypothetical protein